MNKIVCFFMIIGILFIVTSKETYSGPISEYYLTSWRNNGIYVIQGDSVIRSWASGGSDEIPIAVNDTIKTYGYYYSGSVGKEYTLDGTLTGTSYPIDVLQRGYHDGATDGTYNYAWAYHADTVYRFDSDWQNSEALFTVSTGGRRLGITYDPLNNSLWVSSWGGYFIENYSMTGQLLSSFSTADPYLGALAMDYADGTLWVTIQGTSTLKQYDRLGNLQQTATISGAPSGFYGGEFSIANVVPEPSSLLLLLGTCLLFGLKFAPIFFN